MSSRPCSSGPGSGGSPGAQLRRGVLRRLAHRVLIVGRQPFCLHHHHGPVRGAARVAADRFADRDHPGAGAARARSSPSGRRRSRPSAGSSTCSGRSWSYTAVKLAREGDTGDEDYQESRLMRWVERVLPATTEWHGPHLTVRERRSPARDADAVRPGRARHDGPALRARLDPGDLRPDQGAVPGPDGQHLRVDGSAPALLPDRWAAAAAGLPELRAGCAARRSSASS